MIAVALAACGERADPSDVEARDDDPGARQAEVARKATQAPPPVLTGADSARVMAGVARERDSLQAAFNRIRVLRWREVWTLHRDKNAAQIAVAQRLGIRAGGEAEIQRLTRAGRLVALGDSTEYWVLRNMTHSVPYVTPDARKLLVEVGRRFHARLDSAGLPRYRMKITSAMRTDESQAQLRKINANASRIVSAHEYGTTVDVSHERFAVPAPPDSVSPAAWALRSSMLEEVGKTNGRAMQAILGRILLEMRDQGDVMVMMEDRQTVYHFTVARPFRR